MANDQQVPPGLTGLVDDAAMFPPGNAPLDDAVRDHRMLRASAYSSMVGPLLIRDTDVTRIGSVAESPLAIAVIGTAGSLGLRRARAELRDFPHITVAGVEVPLPHGDLVPTTKELVSALKSIAEGATVSVELPRALAGLDAAWIRAADEVVTAGFQVTQPVTGFEQHGFLNIMVAVHRLLSGATVDGIVPVLESRESNVLAAVVGAWSEEDAAAVRRAFRGFGSCGVTEPYEDLVDLELKRAHRRVPDGRRAGRAPCDSSPRLEDYSFLSRAVQGGRACAWRPATANAPALAWLTRHPRSLTPHILRP